MGKVTILIAIVCLNVYGIVFAENKQEVNIETNENDPFITKMYAREIDEGDNSELPLENKHHKHHKGNKKHLHGIFHGGYGGAYHGGIRHHSYNSPIGLPIDPHYGNGIPHYDLHHIGGGHVSQHIPISHAPELPIIHLGNHHHHQHHPIHHGHFAHYPEYMPLPYTLPMCVMEKDDDDDKKKDDKKKDDKKKDKKSKRQLVPCHYYGPPGAGWGAYTPGWTGGGWGAPYWY